ncbi:MAG: hypothetical protein U1A27_01285 [Phycisphaerae bacterium]
MTARLALLLASSAPGARFAALDWGVLAVYLVGTTWLGARLAGRAATIRDFFLGGRKLPAWAVAGSNIATEVSAVTFIAVPAIVFRPGGNFTYLQLALGSILARLIIAYLFVPAYYAREIYSPYEFMGQRLGPGVNAAATALFMLGATLAQGVRVLTTALVLEVIADVPLVYSIWVIGAFAIAWTLLGGITTVIWTDVIQFAVLLGGAAVSLAWVFKSVPGGAATVLAAARDAGKFHALNLSLNPALEYTLWAGLFGTTFLNLAALGTDQVMAQRMFCCRDVTRPPRDAPLQRRPGRHRAAALRWRGALRLLPALPLPNADAQQVRERAERIFPLYIVRVLPSGITGLVIAAIFAAAISTLEGTLAALSQTTVTAVLLPGWRRRGLSDDATDRQAMRAARWLIIAWGVALCGAATALIRFRHYKNLLDLALAMPGYTYGALLGMLLLALLPGRRDDRGLIWAVPTSVVAIFAISVHANWAAPATWTALGALLLLGAALLFREPVRLALVCVVVLGVEWLRRATGAGGPLAGLAYPWYFPIGTAVTLLLGLGLARGAASRR